MDTVVLREQIFSNSSSSVRRKWQIANCCAPTCKTCTYIGKSEEGFILCVLLTRAEGTYLCGRLAGTGGRISSKKPSARHLLAVAFAFRCGSALQSRCDAEHHDTWPTSQFLVMIMLSICRPQQPTCHDPSTLPVAAGVISHRCCSRVSQHQP